MKIGFFAESALNDSSISANEKSIFTKRTVGELLFDGFNLSVFKQIESFKSTLKLNPFSIADGVSDFYIKRFIG
jgi:hypothetical protein